MKKLNCILLCFVVAMSALFVQCNAAFSGMRVHFLNVGQGDSCFVELPDKRTMLIDASTYSYGDEISDYISDLGYKSIDIVVCSHAHADHIGGMPQIFEDFEIKSVYASSTKSSTKTYNSFISAVKDEGITLKTPFKNEKIINKENLKLKVLNPVKGQKYSDLNDSSIVMKLSYYKTDFLFTGDCSADILNSVADDIEVLKVSHHGSRTGTDAAFIQKTSPEYAVISAGLNNSYNHPHSETISALKGISTYQTAFNGNVEFSCTSGSYSVKSDKPLAKPEKLGQVKLSLTSKRSAVKLNWKKVSGAEKYKVFMAKKKSGRFTLIKTTKKLGYTKKKLKKGKTYFFKAVALKENNSVNKYGRYSKTKSIRVK